MGKTTFEVEFETENISEITLKDHQNTVYKVYAKCSQCGERHKNELHVDPNEELPLPSKGNRGSTNCVWKCNFCDRKSYIDVIVNTFQSFNADKPNKPFSISFESRGCDLIDWEIEPETLKIIGVGGQEFENVDGKEWSDFDENAGESVSLFGWTVSTK